MLVKVWIPSLQPYDAYPPPKEKKRLMLVEAWTLLLQPHRKVDRHITGTSASHESNVQTGTKQGS
jgi:hypothetical protein